MSRINGEKARANIAKRNRNAQRVKDRTRVAEIRSAGKAEATPAAKPAAKRPAKKATA
jgi:hypothetical protein